MTFTLLILEALKLYLNRIFLFFPKKRIAVKLKDKDCTLNSQHRLELVLKKAYHSNTIPKHSIKCNKTTRLNNS